MEINMELNLQDMNAYLRDLYATYPKIGPTYPEAGSTKQTKAPIAKAYKLDQVIENIKAGDYIVGSFSADSGLSFSATPALHSTAEAARAECKRLARISPGKLYIFVMLTGAEMVPTVTSVSV